MMTKLTINFTKLIEYFLSYLCRKLRRFRNNLSMMLLRAFVNNAGELRNRPIQSSSAV